MWSSRFGESVESTAIRDWLLRCRTLSRVQTTRVLYILSGVEQSTGPRENSR